MGDIANITLSNDLIEPIVRAQLQASITAALGRSDLLVAQVVQTLMNQKVDSEGRTSQYNGGEPLITWMANTAIKEAASEAIKEWFSANKDEMKKKLRAAITKNATGMAESFVLSMANSAESHYHHKIEVTISPMKDPA